MVVENQRQRATMPETKRRWGDKMRAAPFLDVQKP
jgi:hypothetical protein